MQSVNPERPKEYAPPAVTRLTQEEALEFLHHHAGLGDPGALEILKMLYLGTETSDG